MGRINVRVNDQLKWQLEEDATTKGLPSDVVRRAQEEHIRQRSSRLNCRNLGEHLGILASATGLPSDLSTRPKHMEGFGRE
jgi:hypothetical protein